MRPVRKLQFQNRSIIGKRTELRGIGASLQSLPDVQDSVIAAFTFSIKIAGQTNDDSHVSIFNVI